MLRIDHHNSGYSLAAAVAALHSLDCTVDNSVVDIVEDNYNFAAVHSLVVADSRIVADNHHMPDLAEMKLRRVGRNLRRRGKIGCSGR